MAGESAGKGEVRAFLASNAALCGLTAFAFTCLAMIGYSLTSWVPSYMDRHFGWPPERYGAALSMMNILGALALIVCGRTVDWLFTRGMRDAHLRFYTWTIATLSPAIIYAFLAANPYVFLACYALIQIITVPFIVYGSAIIALLAPSQLRGQLLGLLMFVFNIVAGGGPALVGFMTDHVFGNEADRALADGGDGGRRAAGFRGDADRAAETQRGGAARGGAIIRLARYCTVVQN